MFDLSPRTVGGKRLASIAVLLSVISLGAAAAPQALIGKDAPDFVLKGLDGRNLRLSEFRGQVVLLDFWARWAGDTRVEMPVLDRINTTYQRAGLVVLGVSIDQDQERAAEFAAAMRVTYPILFDTGNTTGRDYAIQRIPLTILIDRSGVVRFARTGFKKGDERVFVDQIRELLRE